VYTAWKGVPEVAAFVSKEHGAEVHGGENMARAAHAWAFSAGALRFRIEAKLFAVLGSDVTLVRPQNRFSRRAAIPSAVSPDKSSVAGKSKLAGD